MSWAFSIVKLVLVFLAHQKRQEFILACKDPKKAQDQLKKRILTHSKRAWPKTPTSFSDYEQQEELTNLPVTFYETTSGSTGKKKRIPYNKLVLKSFEEMFLLWCHDLVFYSSLGLKKGKFFMSISPQIGLENHDDRKYLSLPLRILLSPFLISSPDSHQARSGEEFLFSLSKDLLKSPELEVISIWSPTYFLSILEFIEKYRDKLELPKGEIQWDKIWPELKLISCWNSAGATLSAQHLQKKIPLVKIQGKGLLMTEAAVTIPWTDARTSVPLVNSTYLEFLDDAGSIKGLHEIELSKIYTVLISQFNGFLRYNTLDEVLVTGFYFKTPTLEFLGRRGGYSDLAGEKLSEKNLRELFADLKVAFVFLPIVTGSLPYYEVWTQDLSTNWDLVLKSLFHYNLARELGQLKEIQVRVTQNLNSKILSFNQQRGMSLGNIKEKLLITNIQEAQDLREWILQETESSQPRSTN